MEINRKELDQLITWINKPNRKPLIIRGARQVGKSTLVRRLAEKTKRFCLELNFEHMPELADFFTEKDPKTILKHLTLHYQISYDPEHILLFLDEIQVAPSLLAVLRYFYEKFPELPVIAAGSLLDFALEVPQFSMPVGRIEYFHLGPLSFEDFLIAIGENSLVDWIRNFSLQEKIPIPLHQRLIDYVKQYWLIGGMPEIVAHYSEFQDFQETNNLKQNILQTYQDDFHKYGKTKLIPLLRRVFNIIPGLIGQSIKYANLDRESKSTQVREALDDLHLARVIRLVFHSDANGLPLRSQINDKVFKAIFLDIGLLCGALGLNHLSILKSPDWAWINRGSLAEQFIGQMLLKLTPVYQAPELFYWTRGKSQSAAEIDYVWQYENQIIPIEVKAGKTGSLKSLHYFMNEKNWKLAVRFNADFPSFLKETSQLADKTAVTYQLLSLPFYFAEQLDRLLGKISIAIT